MSALRRRYGHARSRKVSLGFQVVDTKTGEVLSEIFARREPAREIAGRLYREKGLSTGVRHLEDYIAAEDYPAWKAARKGGGS